MHPHASQGYVTLRTSPSDGTLNDPESIVEASPSRTRAASEPAPSSSPKQHGELRYRNNFPATVSRSRRLFLTVFVAAVALMMALGVIIGAGHLQRSWAARTQVEELQQAKEMFDDAKETEGVCDISAAGKCDISDAPAKKNLPPERLEELKDLGTPEETKTFEYDQLIRLLAQSTSPSSNSTANVTHPDGFRIVASISSFGHRLFRIEDSLISLRNQTRRPDRLYVHVPRKVKRLDADLKGLPRRLMELERMWGGWLVVVRPEDYGPRWGVPFHAFLLTKIL
ncbi:hypothetical protein HDU96_005545 [Phlyctochytrium bullatum]|nr:hypothetical protein HDU96_005545 [Phlyctochytrium bullatum]